MKKLTVILMVLALVFTSVFAQGAAEGATTAKKGSVYWLNFKLIAFIFTKRLYLVSI